MYRAFLLVKVMKIGWYCRCRLHAEHATFEVDQPLIFEIRKHFKEVDSKQKSRHLIDHLS